MTTDIKKSFWQKIPFLYPYALLARWDRPIGIWLLFWPCAWGLLLAPGFAMLDPLQRVYFIALFFAGAVLMRGAGCTLNDIIDRRLDAQVERTRHRPLPSGQVSVMGAILFCILQCLCGAWILFQLPPLAIWTGVATLPLIAAYPWMKRITYWPQLFLGLVFNAGALFAWATLENSFTLLPFVLYLAAILWTLAYDSVYAFMDVQHDADAGIKSTVLKWGMNSKAIIGWLWGASAAILLLAMYMAGVYGPLAYILVITALIVNLGAHTFWNVTNDGYTLVFFKLQARIGLLIAMALAVPVLLP